jgi:hypothetical protein
VVLPFHPRQQPGLVQRAALTFHWLLVIPASVIGVFLYFRRGSGSPALLVWLIAATLLPLVLIYFSPDLRYRAGADLFLGAFAGHAYLGILRRCAPFPRTAEAAA